MGYEIPGLRKDPNVVVTISDPVFTGSIRYNGTTIDTVSADLNKLSGFNAAGISPVKCLEVEVDCSAGGTAQTAAIGTVPAGSIILEVMTYCSEAFNGDATKTFQVGVTGNTDNYIDNVDCPVTLAGVMSIAIGTNQDQKTAEATGAAIAIIATWTNTASATAGVMTVKVVYI